MLVRSSVGVGVHAVCASIICIQLNQTMETSLNVKRIKLVGPGVGEYIGIEANGEYVYQMICENARSSWY